MTAQICSTGSCKSSNKIYGICDDKKLYRLTFSKTLAEYIANLGNYQVRQFDLQIGKTLEPGEKSRSGIYAIVSKQKGIILRASLIQGIAELYRDESFREIKEAFLVPL